MSPLDEKALPFFKGYAVDSGSRDSSWDVWIKREEEHRWIVEVRIVHYLGGHEETFNQYDFNEAQLVDFATLSDLLALQPDPDYQEPEYTTKNFGSGWIDDKGKKFNPQALPAFTRRLLLLALHWNNAELIHLICDIQCIRRLIGYEITP